MIMISCSFTHDFKKIGYERKSLAGKISEGKRASMAKCTTPLSPKSRSTLFSDVKLLMHGYGDVSSPISESVELVVSILKQQTFQLVCHLADVCNLRETTSITQDEILFLFRNNKAKLQRLLNHVKAKELRSTINKDVETTAVEPSGKRLKLCENFLSSLGSVGRASEEVMDVGRQRRLVRQDLMTRTMSEDSYMKYHEARQVNLGKKLKSAKVRELLFGDIEKHYKISPFALELLAYCMHETIAEIVDLAISLKVERKRSKDIIDRLNPLQRSLNSDWMTQQADLSYEVSASVKPVSLAHQPTESLNIFIPTPVTTAVSRKSFDTLTTKQQSYVCISMCLHFYSSAFL
ncbi:hypothetical protein EB796_023331 [Bugula neritina]|uniref:SUPT3H n=1 Tax=Bugula neritina TaxID=10212 RepID=A0A7J7IWY3_BUGNE|nr:hypothetical protein EB796_023331 [Bugula neritina]